MMQLEEQEKISIIMSKFEEETKTLSLNEKIEIIRGRKRNKPENDENYGWTEEDSYLYWYYTQLRESNTEQAIRDTLKGLTYEEATSALKGLAHSLEREAKNKKL